MLVHADVRVSGSLVARRGARFRPLSFPQPCSSTWRGTFWAHYVASAVLGAGARAKARGLRASVAYDVALFCSQSVTTGRRLGTIWGVFVRKR